MLIRLVPPVTLVSGDRQILAGRREDAELLLLIRASTSSSMSGRQTFKLENMIVRTSVVTTRMMITVRVILEHRSILVQQRLTAQRRRLHATVSTTSLRLFLCISIYQPTNQPGIGTYT